MTESLVPVGDSVEITALGLVLKDDIAIDDWLDLGYTLAGLERAFRWCIGDWLTYGEFKYGEMYAQGEAVTGLHPDHLRNLKYIASNVELSLRRDKRSDGKPVGPSWHQPVAKLDTNEKKEFWLGLAERHNWTRNELRERIATSNQLPAPSQTIEIPVLSDAEVRVLALSYVRAKDTGKRELEEEAFQKLYNGLRDEL